MKRSGMFPVMPRILALFMAAPVYSAPLPGDTGTLTFPIARAEGAEPLVNVRLSLAGAPPWLELLPDSPLGPATVHPGQEVIFRVDYRIGPAAAADPAGAFDVTISHESPVAPASKTWRIETPDALSSFRASCRNSEGAACGTWQAPDRTPPVSRVVYDGPVAASSATVFIATRTVVRLEAEDPVTPYGETRGIAYIGTVFDRIILSSQQLERSSGPFALAQDPYALFYAAVDLAGNYEDLHVLDLRVDGTPPETSVRVGEPSVAMSDGMLLVSAMSPVTFLPLEISSSVVASGVRDSLLSVNGAAFSAIAGTFTLSAPDGPKELRWFSRDNVLNEEPVKSTTVVLDATPPVLSLSCPGPSAPGFCRVFEGVIPVRGSVSDLHLSSRRLDWAPGRAAASGFTLIASGTDSVSGDLASWDASALSGFVTLRLTATDAVANASSQAVEVYVGDPARVYALGGRKTFDKPSGVAVDASSRVYVVDAGRDRIFVYDAQGREPLRGRYRQPPCGKDIAVGRPLGGLGPLRDEARLDALRTRQGQRRVPAPGRAGRRRGGPHRGRRHRQPAAPGHRAHRGARARHRNACRPGRRAGRGGR